VGFRPTRTPFACNASAFAAAVPLEPDTIAPAWPMVFPGGAGSPRCRPRPVSRPFRDVVGGTLLLVSADLAAHDDQLRLVVGFEHLDDVREARARHRVSADPDDRGVAEAALGDLVADLVGQRAGAKHEPDAPFLEDLRRDDPDGRLAR
jgi:hypothetical protein